MSISRRQFFRGLTPHGTDPQQDYLRRVQTVESYVRKNLLPYDFALTGDQTAEVLRAAVDGIEVATEGELLDDSRLRQLREIVEERVQVWRQEYLKAEEARQLAIPFVREFLSQVPPEDVDRLKQRCRSSNSSLSSDIEREVQVWLSSLPNNRLAICDSPELRELVFSELRSWC
jgi:hypothetical protein